MRIILTGQRSFGRAVLEALGDRHQIAGVVAPSPDDPLGALAWQRGYDIEFGLSERWVKEREADLIVAAHSHAFIGRKSRAATRLGALGYHPSLLPRHRGRDAVNWTVRMQDPVAGGTVYWFTDNVDGGPVAAQDWCFVRPGETASDLWRDKLFPMGVRLLVEVLADLDQGRIVAVPQDEAYATWEPSLDTKPLYRPELPEIGAGPEGFRVVAHPDQLRAVI